MLTVDGNMDEMWTRKYVFTNCIQLEKVSKQQQRNPERLVFCVCHVLMVSLLLFVFSSRFRETDVHLQGRNQTKTANMTEVRWYCCVNKTNICLCFSQALDKQVCVFLSASAS